MRTPPYISLRAWSLRNWVHSFSLCLDFLLTSLPPPAPHKQALKATITPESRQGNPELPSRLFLTGS